MRTLKVSRFELWPNDDLTHYQVGFTYTTNGRNGYNDTVIHRDEVQGKTDEEIVSIAYSRLKDTIEHNMVKFESSSPLLGVDIPLNGPIIDTENDPQSNWHDDNKLIRVIISDTVLNDWFNISTKDQIMARVSEVSVLLEYYKLNTMEVVEENKLNYIYLNELFPEHKLLLEKHGAVVEDKVIVVVEEPLSGDTTNPDEGGVEEPVE